MPFDEPRAADYWQRALAADPGHTRARAEHALWWMVFCPGRMDDGVAESARAVKADPLNAWATSMHALILSVAGRASEAERAAAHALSLDADSFLAHWTLQVTRTWGGDASGSIAAAEAALVMSGRSPWALGLLAEAYAAAGQQPHALAVHRELEARATAEYVPASFRAGAAMAAGYLDLAADMLELAIEERDGMVVLSFRRPGWEPLRAHPRFRAILTPTGLTSVG